MRVSKLSVVLIFAVIENVCSQEYFEERHRAHFSPTFPQNAKKFQIKSNSIDEARTEFEKYANNIHIGRDNSTVIYQVKVEVLKPHKNHFMKKLLKKSKSKKYNVPLKKNSMKLSNFETFLRKMAVQSNHNSKKFDFFPTSAGPHLVFTTKQPKLKFKPIPSKLNSFSKVIKPVRSRLITLTA